MCFGFNRDKTCTLNFGVGLTSQGENKALSTIRGGASAQPAFFASGALCVFTFEKARHGPEPRAKARRRDAAMNEHEG